MDSHILLTIFGLLIFVVIVLLVFRPIFKKLGENFEKNGKITHDFLAILFLFLLVSSWVTEELGVHALFGAFMIGVAMPKDNRFVHALTEKINDLAVVLFLPIFFALTGLHTSINLIDNPQLWLFAILIIFVAILGKFGGATVAARISGMSWRDSGSVGVLMNTRGLMELVLLNIRSRNWCYFTCFIFDAGANDFNDDIYDCSSFRMDLFCQSQTKAISTRDFSERVRIE